MALKDALDALPAVQQLGLSEQYAALTSAYNAQAAMSEQELFDARAEGIDLSLYNEMVEAYDDTVSSAKEDTDHALEAAMAFIGTVTLLASAAFVFTKFALGR